jgi:hypothetical protein
MSEFSDREFILNGRWSGETCCLKKRPKPGEKAGVMGYIDFGVITNNRAPFSIYRQEDGSLAGHYKTIDELLEDGWIVD